MKYTYKIIATSEYIATPDVSNCSISKTLSTNEIFYRTNLEGDLLFYGGDFDFLRGIFNLYRFVNFQVIENGGDTYNFLLDLWGEYDFQSKIANLKTISNDDYHIILKNIDKEINILSVNDFYSLSYDYERIKLQFNIDEFLTNPEVGSFWLNVGVDSFTGLPVPIWARQRYLFKSQLERDIYIQNGWILDETDSNYILKDWVNEYQEPDNTLHITSIGYFNPSDIPMNIQYPDNDAYLSDYTGLYVRGGGSRESYVVKNEAYYGSGKIETKRWLKFRDIVTYMINSIDDTIVINDNSFLYFNNFAQYQNLFIGAITDMILITDSQGVYRQKSNPATICNLTLSSLFRMLKDKFGIFWRINNKFFEFKHWTEAFTPSGSDFYNNFTNYYGINFSIGNNKISYQENEKFNRIKRADNSGNIDFIGTDILFPKIENLNIKEISFERFVFDINDLTVKPQRYSAENISQTVMASTDYILQDYISFWVNNDGSDIWDFLDGTAWAASTIFKQDRFISLINSSGIAYLYSNSFTVLSGETIKISGYWNNLITTTSFGIILEKYLQGNWIQITGWGFTTTLSITFEHTYISYDEGLYRLSIASNGAATVGLGLVELFLNKRYVIRKATGKLTGLDNLTNVELSTANTDDNDFAVAYDNKVIINNNERILSDVYLSETLEMTLDIPLNKLNNLNVNAYFTTVYDNIMRLKKVTKKLISSIANVILIK
jgi:hypothetical protein